ncbi:MAG: carboxypeptidase regulatory-like domain-containing protein [Planctomycetes bacterium]|nr:carboxypeptidase regulatory-like domain-containing protein [Planctomycetota bacterium]
MNRSLALVVGVVLAALVLGAWWFARERSQALELAQTEQATRESSAPTAADPLVAPTLAVASTVPSAPTASDPPADERATVAGNLVLAGRVVWGNGSFAGDAAVTIRSERDASFASDFRSDSLANFRVEVPDRGPYRLTAERTKRGRGSGFPAEGVPCRALASGVLAPRSDVTLVLAGEFEVRGRVLGADGVPPRSFHVRARAVGDELSLERVVSEEFMPLDGHFALALPAGGVLRIAAESACAASSEEVERPVRGVVDDVELVCGASAALRGFVVGPDGAPVARAKVRCESRPTIADRVFVTIHPREWESQPDGSFEIGCLDPGLLRLTAVSDEFTESEPLELELAAGEFRDGLVLRLRRGATLDVCVDFATPDAEREVDVELLDREKRTPRCALGEPSSKEPTRVRFHHENAPLGDFDLEVTIGDVLGYRTLEVPITLRAGGAETVELVDDVRLRTVLAGRVTLDGEPVADALLSVASFTTDFFSVAETTDADGRFECRLARAGDWSVEIEAVGLGARSMDARGTRASIGEDRSWRAHIAVPEVDRWQVEVELGGAALAGRVVGFGTGSVGGEVSLSPVGTPSVSSSDSVDLDENGAFAFESLPPGTYRLEFCSPASRADTERVVAPLEVSLARGERRTGVELALERGSKVILRLRGFPSGVDDGRAYLLARNGFRSSARITVQDDRVFAVFEPVPLGEYRAFACVDRSYGYSEWIALTEARHEVDLAARPPARVVVREPTTEGAPSICDFAVLPRGERLEVPVCSDERPDGRSYALFVPPGEWNLRVDLADGRTSLQPFTARLGETTEVVVRVE